MWSPLARWLPEVGGYVVETYRQSGNTHQGPRYFGSAAGAIAAAMTTFRRGRINEVLIHESTPALLSFRRPFHDHFGHHEGRKLGWIDIRRIDDPGTED
ncbi:hypothetical protein [Ottowia sp.]|uniref:hypothetical protein n=1 Tax=Ottowia sp. TaxID=1898956 RepID=UPI0039E4E3FB